MITKAQSISLSIIRVLSMCLIVACHITQKYDMPIAFLLNVGVQIFFLLYCFTGNPLYDKETYIPYYMACMIFLHYKNNISRRNTYG